MTRILKIFLVGFVLAGGWILQPARPQAASPQAPPPAQAATSDPRAVLDRYCISCHNARVKTAGLALDAGTIGVENVGDHADVWEKVVRKLHSRSMPPPGARRPDPATYVAVASSLEAALDKAAAAHPNPGRATIHRLNRTEYANVIRDLLGVDVDARSLLPADDADLGFDNMADILSVSPVLLERSMSAARKISRIAIGERAAALATETFIIPRTRYQDDRMDDDLPFGSRGGVAIRHHFPVDAEYRVQIRLRRQLYDYIRGLQRPQQLEVRLDGKLVKTITVGGAPGMPPPKSYAGDIITDREWEDYTQHADDNLVASFQAKAGPGVVGVSFVQARSERDGVLQPRMSGKNLAVAEVWSSPSEAPEAAVDRVLLSGPYNATGLSDTPSRTKILTCRPARRAEEEACAKTILSTIARRAFRRPVTPRDIVTLTSFYNEGSAAGGFEAGIRRGVESILVDPEFLFRLERDPSGVAAGTPYRISDLELASRLSFFLWSSIPDDELLDVAARGKLKDPAVLEQQARRMLRDEKAKSLVTNFAGQWLSLRKLRAIGPTPELYPDFDENLREAFLQETEMFIESQLREDTSILDLLKADYTFLNERLARHYGIPGVYGSRFRRVALSDETRGGLLGQGAILSVTSHPNRTSPVIRGHWLLDNLLGAPPPPPPPNIPALPESGQGGKPSSVRERLEEHRKNPVCANCHAPMDPLGFALENYDGIGKWRAVNEVGGPIDASGRFPDGTQFDGLPGLKKILLEQPEQFVGTVAEKLLMYALGRGIEHYDMPQVRHIIKQSGRQNYSWSSVILGIITSPPFQMRRSES